MRLIKNHFFYLSLLFFHGALNAQIQIRTDGFVYQQSFDSLVNNGSNYPWSNGNTLKGWYAANATNLISEYSAGNGSSSGSGLWSFGSISSTDRALGSLTNSSSGSILYGVRFHNSTSITLNSITLSFKAEQWRVAATSTKGYQRVKVSFKVSTSLDQSISGLFDNTFTEIPECYLITLDSVSQYTNSLDGNSTGYFANITVSFPIQLAPDQEVFIRFLDEDVSGFDSAMAIDDLSIVFNSSTLDRVHALSDYNFFSYADQGIIADIPLEGQGYNYIIPSGTDQANWEQILDNFYLRNWSNVSASPYLYQLVEFYDKKNSKRYFMLRKQNISQYFWGTYVQAEVPVNSVCVIQAPHPVKDTKSGRQAAAVFEMTGAHSFMVAGISRCASSIYSTCTGQTEICGPLESYRKSDVAHNTDAIFHLATVALANLNSSAIFVQLHGFAMNAGDPNFIVSCGTMNGMDKTVPDYPVQIREKIIAANPNWKAKLVHVDNYSRLGGMDNVQGRYLNLYNADICTSGVNPLTVTNRFIHIEQFIDVRVYTQYYSTIANLISNVVNPTTYQNHVSITTPNFQYSQNFDTYSTSNLASTWGNNLSLSGWYAAQDNNGLFSTYFFDNGASNIGGLYNYGETNSTDRSLGSLNDDLSGNIIYGVLFKNETSTTINSITISYDAKQWRDAVNSISVQKTLLSYIIGKNIDITARSLLSGAGYTNLPNGDLQTIQNSLGNVSVNGDAVLSKINFSFPVTIGPGDQIFIRFKDQNETGLDRAMAIDNFSINFSVVALPVKWIAFNVKTENQYPVLSWITANEDNCSYYEIQRSLSGNDFTRLALSPCQLNLTNNTYHYIDSLSRGAKIFYYRVAQYDRDNSVSYSPIVSYNRTDFYNPYITVEGRIISVKTDFNSGLKGAYVFDLLGQPVVDIATTSSNIYEYSLDLSGTHQSVFIIKFIFENSSYVFKIFLGD